MGVVRREIKAQRGWGHKGYCYMASGKVELPYAPSAGTVITFGVDNKIIES